MGARTKLMLERLASARQKASSNRQYIADVRRQLSVRKELMARAASVSGSTVHCAGWPKDVPCEAVPQEHDAPRTFAAVTELIRHVERETLSDVSFPTHLIETIAIALQSKADPSLLMGALLEGIAQTVLERIPAAEQSDTVIALFGLLWNRVSEAQTGQG